MSTDQSGGTEDVKKGLLAFFERARAADPLRERADTYVDELHDQGVMGEEAARLLREGEIEKIEKHLGDEESIFWPPWRLIP